VKRTETQVTPRVAPVDGEAVTLAVTEYGDRSATTHLLLVHGFPDDQEMWQPVVAALPEEWHVVTYDVRGSGRSSRPTERSAYRTDLLVEDLVAVLEATVPDGQPVHLVGHDWGSTAMWDVVAAETWDPRLEGRLATYTSASGPPLDHLASMGQGWRGRWRMRSQTLHSWYVWLFLLPWLPEQMWGRSQQLTRRIARRLDPTVDLLPWGPAVRRNAVLSVNLYRANVLERLGHPLPWRTSVPVLLVIATRDAWVLPLAVSGLEARCRDLTRAEIDEGHWVPRARPQEFADVVAGFVRGHST
jgi:pimeloyl-ACP methyl ester carboxylesterase